MEKRFTQELGRRRDGTIICRHFFINEDNTNYMALAHSYFTRVERKIAKQLDKLNK